MQVRSQQNDTIDAIVWRYLGATVGLVERTLEMNPSLAQYGAVLPRGTLVTLPAASPRTAATTELIQLWD